MIVWNEAQRSSEQIATLEALASRVVNSPQLNGSPKLREFFLYVVDCALRQAPEEATEQQIGVHVFHRRPGYNSGDDSIVRSQARLLRAKLIAYFDAEGIHEPIVIEIPKGQYFPIFRAAHELVEDTARPVAAEAPALVSTVAQIDEPREVHAHPPAVNSLHARLSWPFYTVVGLILMLIMGAVVGFLWRGHLDYPATPALDAFWKPFYADGDALVIYSNPAFLGNPSVGLRLLEPQGADQPSAASAEVLDETYTGTGEAEAIHTLTQLFDAHGSRFTLKRSRLITWDEARSRSLIFVGAPSQNTALNDLQTLTQFRIAETPEHHGFVVNAHPQPGEPATFPQQTATQETAIVALLPGLRPETRIAIFCGLSTIGTQEAVEFLSQPESARILIDRVGMENHRLAPFEAVLRISTSKGVAMEASFLAIHKH